MGYYDSINLMLPTRCRVENNKLITFIMSSMNMCSNINNIKFTFLIDRNDFETIEFFLNSKELIKADYQVLFNNTVEVNLAKFYNQIYEETKFNNPSTLVSLVGDDMEWITRDWDVEILKTVNESDGLGFVYCDDDYVWHDKMSVNMFASRKLVELTGEEFMCSLFPVDIIDRLWYDVAKECGLLNYLGNVKLRHNHATFVGKDDTYIQLRNNYEESVKNNYLYSNEVNKRVNNIKKALFKR